MRIDTVVFYQITDPKLFTYGVENPHDAIENLTATTLRNIIGDLELDQTLTSRETINTKMRAALDIATDPWGIKGQPCGAEEHHPSRRDPECHGEADEGRSARDVKPLPVQKVRRRLRSWRQKVPRSPQFFVQKQISRQPSFVRKLRRRR